VQAIANDHKRREMTVFCLQDLHTRLAAANGQVATVGDARQSEPVRVGGRA
jgi:hypothetical protein